MKHMVLLASLFAVSISWANEIDLSKSKVTWTGSKVVGSSHTGEVRLKKANLKYDNGEPKSGHVVIDMTSITNTDLKDANWNAKLVGHLKSGDFFSVEKFKTADLKINKIQKAGDKHYLLQGKLTIKGKTQSVKMKAEVVKDDKSMQTVKVDFNFDRTKYGVKYGSGAFFTNLGDKMISDDVAISVELYIKKKSELAAN